MNTITQCARIMGPISYLSETGCKQNIPIRPCLLECIDGRSMDIIWGACGQNSVTLTVEAVEAAQGSGQLMLMD